VPLPGEDLPPGLAEASWSSTGERTLPPLPRPRQIGLTPSRRVAVPAFAALASAAAFALALGMLALAVLTVQRHVDPTAEAPPTLTEILPAYPLHGAPP
jgi:hypothetical protein